MSDDLQPSESREQFAMPPSHGRILVIMAVIGLLGTIAGAAFVSPAFGFGVLVGSTLAFINYYWLKRSLKTIFDVAADGQRPRMLAGNYFLRYIILGTVVAIIYATGVLPIVAIILGMAGFGFAVVIEGFVRIFQSGAEARTK